jgi:zinc protease
LLRVFTALAWWLTGLFGLLLANRANAVPLGTRVNEARPEHFRLRNGLEVLLQREPRQSLVATVMSYEVGDRDDPPGYEGLAHLIEHLSYSRSRHLPPLAALSELANAGSPLFNGITGHDNTFYYSVVEPSRVALPIWLESERLGFTLEHVDEAALAHERKVIRNEALGARDRNRWYLPVWQKQYPAGHPYFTPQDPTAATDSVELSAVLGHFQRSYRPDNARLVIVGALDTRRVTELVHQYFDPIPNPPRKLARRVAPQRAYPGRETLSVEDRIYTGRRLVMVWPAPTKSSPDWIPYQALFRVLDGSGVGSLNFHLVDDNPFAATVTAALESADLDASLVIEVDLGVDPRTSFERAEWAVEVVLSRLCQVALGEAALAHLRATMAMELLAKFQNVSTRTFLHLESLRRSGRPYSLAEDFARWAALRPETLLDVARRYFGPRRRLSARLMEAKGWVPVGGRISYSLERAP